MQGQDNNEKMFFQKLKPGDYVDARYADQDWKIAKVIDRQNKYLGLVFDGFAPNNEQVYINPMRVKPLRAVTTAYTGPIRNVHLSTIPIPQLKKHIQISKQIMKCQSAYEITQYFRGQLFVIINSLLMNDIKLSQQQNQQVNNFLFQIVAVVMEISKKSKQFLAQYFICNLNNKYVYLTSSKIAIVFSLSELLYLINFMIAQGPQIPKLFKNSKQKSIQPKIISYVKQYLKQLNELLISNDLNGRWLPTYTRLTITKILIKYKQQSKILNIKYEIKDYLQYFAYWASLMQIISSEQNQKRYIQYMQTVMLSPSPFDSKLKTLAIMRKILQKQTRLTFLSALNVIEMINTKKIVDSLLQYFNPEIFKRYIPILKQCSLNSKKTLTQSQIDCLFKLMKTSHQSQTNIIYEIIVNISEFIGVQVLDNIYADIQKNIDINQENAIKFIRDFTIKAIKNFNNNKNKGFISTLIGRKKSSSRFGYYGLNIFFKQIHDTTGKFDTKYIPFVIDNIAIIFQNEVFHNQRFNYMQLCLSNIEKKLSYGQSVRLLHKIINTYPINALMSQNQQSIIAKLDDKRNLIDTLTSGLKNLQPIQTQKKLLICKVDAKTSIKYCFNFIQQFGAFFKSPFSLRHINWLWHMPEIFEFLRKSRQSNDSELPSWKRRYFKKIPTQIIKSILLQVIKQDKNIIPTQQFFDCINELILCYNLTEVKSIQLTQRTSVRYKNLNSIVGLNFYDRFLSKLMAVERHYQKKNGVKNHKNDALIQKVIRAIILIHLRPTNYQQIQIKSMNWKQCLIKIAITTFQQKNELCIQAIQYFLQQIKGRKSKQINASGRLDILVSFEGRQRVISLPKNSTILKLRYEIMDAYKIKWNFQMYNTALRRDVKFFEEQDFSINAMGQAIKGPTIIVKKVQQGKLYYQIETCNRFMQLISQQKQFYKILFGLLKGNEKPEISSRIWGIIDNLPVNSQAMDKIRNCKNFTKYDWQSYLKTNSMEELLYHINIINNLLIISNWMSQFKKTQGIKVVQLIFLSMIRSTQPLSEKIRIILSQIILKFLNHDTKENSQNIRLKQQNQNMIKIYNKIKQVLEQQAKKIESTHQAGTQTCICIQSLNLMLKMLLVSSTRYGETQDIKNFLINDGILLNISSVLLFQSHDNFFLQQILQKFVFNFGLSKNLQHQIFKNFIQKYLRYNVLIKKKITQKFFIFLIDFMQKIDKQEASSIYQQKKQIVCLIRKYVFQVLSVQNSDSTQTKQAQKVQQELPEEMIQGCLKLFNQTYQFQIFKYDNKKIFIILLENYVLCENKQIKTHKKLPKSKIKKILFQITKSMMCKNEQLLKIFTCKMVPKLQSAEWRSNTYSSWNLQQQKKQKQFFCGLQNLAATCYINCLFQQLFMIKRFSDQFIKIDSLPYKQITQTNQIYQLQKLFAYLKYGNKKFYSPKHFCQSFITYQGVPIDPTVQNDADQFFNSLMEKIQSFLKNFGHHNILQNTFQGKLSNQLNCQGCPHSSQKIQPFMSIGLNIKNKKTLEDALDGYVEGQILDGDNAYFCQKCQKKVKTLKRLCIKQLPNILVVVLKRFSFNYDEMRKIKINDECRFSYQLNVKKYTSEYTLGQQCKDNEYYDYQLRGVVIHAGTSQGGHYYSFIKQNSNEIQKLDKQSKNVNKWYEFNDQIIEQAEYKRIQEEGFGGELKDTDFKMEKHRNAYILIYEKKTQIDQQKQSMMKQNYQDGSQSFEIKMRQNVLLQNRNAEFLSIILDPFFVKLCQSITRSESVQASHFILLYFHTVLLRDKNKQDYLANIYRLILILFKENQNLCQWFLQQIDGNYITQFLIQGSKIVKFLALGLVIEAIKVLYENKNSYKKCENTSAKVKFQSIQHKSNQNQQQVVNIQRKNIEIQNKVQNFASTPQLQINKNQQKIEQKSVNQQNTQQSKNQMVKIDDQFCVQNKKSCTIIHQETSNTIDKLIINLISKLKTRGMSPYAKIFTYLSSIPEYRLILQKNHYPEKVIQIILSNTSQSKNEFSKQNSNNDNYFGHQNKSCKQKQLDLNYSFLIQSMKFYPGFLTKQQILNFYKQSSSRPATKSLAELYVQTSFTVQQTIQSIDFYQQRLFDDKYKRQDIQKYFFLIRFYYSHAYKTLSRTQPVRQPKDQIIIENIKNICLDSLQNTIKSNQGSYLFMELILIQINKLAYKCEDFKIRWIRKVSNSQKLASALFFWVSQSKRPNFLMKNEQWKRKIINLGLQEKQNMMYNHQTNQEARTLWMLEKNETKHKKNSNNQQIKVGQNELNKKIPQIQSQLDETEINKNVIVGFRSFKIIDRLGILTKVQDQKGMTRWAIIDKNDIQTYIDF